MGIKIAGIEFSAETVGTLEWVGMATPQSVRADLDRVRRGDGDQLLAECLEGAEDEQTIAGWRDYVATLRTVRSVPVYLVRVTDSVSGTLRLTEQFANREEAEARAEELGERYTRASSEVTVVEKEELL